MRPYGLRLAPSAQRSLLKLDQSSAFAALEFANGRLLERPRRLGGPLSDELAGWRAARLGALRIVYWIDEDARVVQVERIEHRSDVYRPR